MKSPTAVAGRAPVALGVLVAAVTAACLGRFRRVEVRGDSMRPLLEPGDRLLAVRSRRVRPGDVVVVRDPRQPRRLLVKRLTAHDRVSLTVRGDNAASSTDSRQFGPLPRSSLRGRVVYRYGPPGRAGRFA